MKPVIRTLAVPALLSFAMLAPAVWAQTSPAPATSAAAAPKAAVTKTRAERRADAVEQRITEMHDNLKITDQQSKQWDAFAQTMRDNANRADQAFRDRAQKLGTMNAVESMKSYADLTKLHSENMEKLSSAMSDLYAVLSDDQKHMADDMYRNQGGRGGKGHGGPRGHKGKGKAPASASSSGAASGG